MEGQQMDGHVLFVLLLSFAAGIEVYLLSVFVFNNLLLC